MMATDSQLNIWRVGAAFLLTPILTAVYYYMVLMVMNGFGYDYRADLSVMLFLLVVPVAFLLEMVLGVPLFLVSRARGWVSAWWFVGSGGLMGIVAWLVISSGYEQDPDIASMAAFVATGFISGLTFFLIYARPLR